LNYSKFDYDFFEQFQGVLNRVPDQVAFKNITRSGEETISFRQVGTEVRQVSRYLQGQGVGPGSSVGLVIENHPRWGIAFLATQSAGAVVVPLDVLHTPETLAKLITHARCSFLFASEKLLPVLDQIQELLPAPLPVLVVGSTGGRYPEWDEVLGSGEASGISLPLVARDIDEPHVILYTSGTTGEPKGVVLTGRNLYRNVIDALKLIHVTDRDHFLGVLPLYHVLALIVNFIVPLHCGARTTFLDVIDAQRILRAFREEGITIFVCVPQFFYLLHRRIMSEIEHLGSLQRMAFNLMLRISHFSRVRLGLNPGRIFFRKLHAQFGEHLRYFGVGGARFDPEVAWSLTDLGFNILQAYGMTETAALTTVTPVTLEGIGSVGRPLPHTQVKIDQPDDHGVGHVMIRGESVTPEYFRNPEATREAFDEEGWLRSGDLGYIDQDGFLYITGRAKEVIVLSSGKNIYPEEIEHFYQSNCPLIKEMCIIGVQDDTGHEGERLHAVIVPDFDELKRQQVVNAYHMIRYLTETLSQQLPPYKRMRSFEIWQEPLPRTTTRKVKRFDVEKRLRSGDEANTEAVETWSPEDDVETRVTTLLQEVKSATTLHPDMNLELDIGLDSLERVEFLSSVNEAFQISIPDEEAAQLFTLRDVFDLVRERLDETGEIEGEKKNWSDFLNEPLGEDAPKEYLRLLKRRPFVEPLVILVAITIRLISKLCFKLKGEGLENLPEDYPFMLCPNHLSFLDAFIVICLLPNRVVRRFYSLGYSDYFSGGLTGFLGGLVRTLPVNPDRNLKQTLRLAAEGLKNDLVLMVFPEGERSIDGTLKPFRKGPAILATQIGVPVVPVGIRGSYEVWRRGSGKISFLPIRIHYGKPLQPHPGESVDDFNVRLRSAVEELI